MAGRDEEKSESVSIARELLGWLFYILIIIGLTYLIVTYIGQRTRVDGSSMETTLSHGDHLLVDKISYRFHEPDRYDIIVFPYLHAENTYYIKRIIGLPGETVQVVDGYTYVNGELLESDMARRLWNRQIWRPSRWFLGKMNILFWGITETTALTAGTQV